MAISTKRAPRIASLLPSTTEIVGLLGLSRHLVAVTHECDVCAPLGLDALISSGKITRVTTSDINPHAMTQSAIDMAVKSSLEHGLSLYGLREDLLKAARPTVVLTQTLCAVCAPSMDEVNAVCRRLGAALALADDGATEPTVHSFEPGTLEEVAQSVVDVGAACGYPERGRLVRDQFLTQLEQVDSAVTAATSRPSMLLLEWLAPPFDGGHWVPDQVKLAGCRVVLNSRGEKSKERSWEEVQESDPDVIVVACCGFDLSRNVEDAKRALADVSHPIQQLRAVREGRIFALDGNRYFARPSPSLAGGAALLARVAHDGDSAVVARLNALDFLPRENDAWARLQTGADAAAPVLPPQPSSHTTSTEFAQSSRAAAAQNAGIPTTGGGTISTSSAEEVEIEDLFQLHAAACDRGETFYTDPSSGLSVFTAFAAKKRGKCCGAGCRHCPYDHERVSLKNRAAKIKVPAILVEAAVEDGGRVRPVDAALFFSGGKDSFLALRALRRSFREKSRCGDGNSFPASAADASPSQQQQWTPRIVLITTFDAQSRVIAHQDVPIADIVRQAQHLNLDLVGVPLLRGGGDYARRAAAAVNLVRRSFPCAPEMEIAFGDLHLEHIKSWRDTHLPSALGVASLSYPLWNAPYAALAADLEESGVPCVISAVTGAAGEGEFARGLVVGETLFSRALMAQADAAGCDAFGERGEFHTLARVWEVSPAKALGNVATGC